MAESDPPHPLKDADPDKCYDVMIAERTALITAKRETEDELVRTVIKLSSGALLLIPGVLFARESDASIFNRWLYAGSVAFIASRFAAMLEQFLSSMAYDRQLNISVDYYQQKSDKTSDPKFSIAVRVAQSAAFALFVVGVTVSAFGLVKIGEEKTMAKPSPPPPPPRPSPPTPHFPGYKDGGRSVPPPAPPPPPPKR